MDQHNELEVFVGNLSYYCQEEDLFSLFNAYLPTINARIIRTDNNTRSLMYGFITFPSMEHVLNAIDLFNGHLFMGRKMKVEMIDPAKDPAAVRAVVQDNAVHISMVSNPNVSDFLGFTRVKFLILSLSIFLSIYLSVYLSYTHSLFIFSGDDTSNVTQ
jgi:RNA recognition motif-containing protein